MSRSAGSFADYSRHLPSFTDSSGHTRMTASLTITPGANFHSRFLAGLSSAESANVLAAATVRQFAAKAVVVSQGNPADYLYLLAKGRMRYFSLTQTGQKLLLRWLGPGDVFGGAALLAWPSSYLVSVETLHNSEAWAWKRDAIRQLASRYPKILENALEIASQYLTFYVSAHIALVCHDARQRTAEILLNLANTIGHPVRGGVEIEISNEELANTANVTLFTASRLLSEWRRQGAIHKSRRKILLHSPGCLLPRGT